MRIGVEEPALAAVASLVDTARCEVATLDLDDLATAVASAMPGSDSAGSVVAVAAAFRDNVGALTHHLAAHADAVREATARYNGIEDEVTVAARRLTSAS
jgi:hypothetical protein